MAKVKQVTMPLGLRGDDHWEDTVVNIYYDSTDHRSETYKRKIPTERFYIKLPQVVADALAELEVRGPDQDTVLQRFTDAIKRYKSLHTETHSIICYEFRVSKEASKSYATGELSVSVWAGAYKETEATAGDGTKRYSYEGLESPANFTQPSQRQYKGPDTHRDAGRRFSEQVPYTKTNEAFFVWLQDRMTDLIARLSDLHEPTHLIEAVAAGRLLPLGTHHDLVQGQEEG